jgi:hypothetical protein
MPIHYIYEKETDKTCLFQGDVLKKTPELIELLQEVHPHYATQTNYIYFLILTQSCDLFRRDGKNPSARYITIAAVRPVDEAITAETKKFQDWWQQPLNVVDSYTFDQLVLFTERLLDNNLPNYFYLHEELSLKINTKCCAFLTLSVAIRVEHYRRCLHAKTAQINDTFRAKLGWLVGNIYSRVGTREWNDHYGKGAVRRKASSLLQDCLVPIDKKKITKGLKELKVEKPINSYSPDEIYEYIKKTKIISVQKELFDRVTALFNNDLKIIDKIRSVLFEKINCDESILLEDLNKTIVKYREVNQELLQQEILKIFIEYIDSILTEDKFPNRDRFIDRIVQQIKQDPIVRKILA